MATGDCAALAARRAVPFLLIAVLATVAASCSSPTAATQESTASEQAAAKPSQPDRSAAKVVQFTPEIRIDYRVPQVEVAGRVILREGPLELFAYSKAPVPKEHESIVCLEAPASLIYQALGLIGLQPGKPARYFPETRETRLPSGDAVDVLVRYERGGETIEESACAWMRDVDLDAPMDKTHWLFTGSERMQDDRFAADVEGTTVTVVDFTSSLMALPNMHTSADAQLWLVANTEVIPPLGTRVTLILRPAKP